MTNVKCTVNSCEYWGEGQKCNAQEILVKNDVANNAGEASHHYLNADMEVAGEMGKQVAQTSPQTCCDTMKLKNQK